MNNSPAKRRLLVASKYIIHIIPVLALVAIIIIQVRFFRIQTARIDALETNITEQFSGLAEQEYRVAEDIKSEIGQRVADSEAELGLRIAAGTAAMGSQIAGTDRRIQGIDSVYAGLLAEQQKRTLDSLYTDTELAEKEREAKALFRSGKYAAASTQYGVVAEARPDDTETRFYYLYSLFLSNKLDRENYRRIREGMLALERMGYHRAEIRSVLEFIAEEERGVGE